jgi:hypothetical protein
MRGAGCTTAPIGGTGGGITGAAGNGITGAAGGGVTGGDAVLSASRLLVSFEACRRR